MAPSLGVLAGACAAVSLTACLAAPHRGGEDGGGEDDGGGRPDALRLGGSYHTHCAIRSGGALYCWGAGGAGQLGDGAALDRDNAVPVLDESSQPLTGVRAVTGGLDHSCAIVGDGTVRCWGSNDLGQLGDGGSQNTMQVETSVVGVTGAAELSAFGPHTCALISGGGVLCWGSDIDGELGNDGVGGPVPESFPMEDAAGLIDDAIAVATGHHHSCAVRADGRVWCTGLNAQGQLGRYSGEAFECSRDIPRVLETAAGEYLEGASQVAGGFRQSCAITGATVECWGDPRCGQLGDGTEITACLAPTGEVCDDEGSSPPVQVDLGVFASCSPIQIGAGEDFACVLCAEGTVGCWGAGTRGRLGNGLESSSSSAVLVAGIEQVEEISVGAQSACARVAGGEVYCWGEGSEGQLGNGVSGAPVFSTSPVPVIGLPP